MTQTHTAHDLKHESPLISCRFDPSGKFVFAGAEDFAVWRWNVESGEKTKLFTDSWVRGLTFSKDGKTIITGGTDGRLIWFPVADAAVKEELKPQREIAAHDGWIRAVATSQDGKFIASAGNDLKVKIWNAADGKAVREFSGHESHIYNLAFHPDGKHLVSGDLKTNLIVWDFGTGKQIRTWKAENLLNYDKKFLAFIGGYRGIAFNKDGTQLAGSGITNVSNAFAGIGNPSVVIFDWKNGAPLTEHLSKGSLQGIVWGVALHPEGTVIGAVGGPAGYLLFWKPGETEDFHRIKLPDTARDLSLSPDGLHLATAHFKGNVLIHKMEKKVEEEAPKKA